MVYMCFGPATATKRCKLQYKTASTSQILRKLRYEMPSGGPEAEEANFMKFHTILIHFVRFNMGHFLEPHFHIQISKPPEAS